MFKREKKIESLGTISNFMNGDHHKKAEKKADYNRANKYAIGSAFVPLATMAPGLILGGAKSAFAAEPVSQCGQVMAVTATQAIPAGIIQDKALAGLAHLFDPLIELLIGVSFPVASALIAFKLFMGFFQDQGQVWEGIGRISIVYVLIQMLPVFQGILKTMGNMV